MFQAQFHFVVAVALFGLSLAESLIGNSNAPSVLELCALVPGALILRPNTCSNWIKCPAAVDGLDIEEGSCVFGLYFDKNLGQCVYKDEIECPYETASTPTNPCSRAADGTFLPDEDNCHGYIYCKNGKEMKSQCPNNLVFDPKKIECVYEHQYQCPARKAVADSNPICKSLPNDVYFADRDDCTKYSHCINGSLTSYTCSEDNAWDHIKGVCLPIDEVTCLPTAKKPAPENLICGNKETTKVGPISDGVSCSGYYFCKRMKDGTRDRQPEHFNCAAGSFFDNVTLSCRDRLNVKCQLDRCEGMGNKYVNVPGDCKAYVLCENGEAKTQGTCPNNYFFDERTQGCTPHVVNYAACSA